MEVWLAPWGADRQKGREGRDAAGAFAVAQRASGRRRGRSLLCCGALVLGIAQPAEARQSRGSEPTDAKAPPAPSQNDPASPRAANPSSESENESENRAERGGETPPEAVPPTADPVDGEFTPEPSDPQPSSSPSTSSPSSPPQAAPESTPSPDAGSASSPAPDSNEPITFDTRNEGEADGKNEPGSNQSEDQGTMTVTGQAMQGYSVFESSAATKTKTPIMETPQSIQVVPRGVFRDQMVTNVGEVLRNVSGVHSGGTNHTGLITQFTARGFVLSPMSNFYKNGRPFIFSVPPPTEAVERLEFVKGPASVLYGQAEPGGVVNLSLKRPTRKFFIEPRVQIGRFNYYKGALDSGGPITASLGYRANVSYTNAQSFRTFQHVKQWVAAGVLGWKIARGWKLNVDIGYQNRQQGADSGLSARPPVDGENYGTRVIDVPISRSLNEPWAKVDVQSVELGYELDGKINRHFSITQSTSVQRQENDETRADPLPILGAMPSQGYRRGDMAKLFRVRHSERLSLYTDLLGHASFETGPFRHRVLAGVEFFRSVRGVTEYAAMYTRARDFNVYEPIYLRQAPPGLGKNVLRLGRNTLRQFGLFAQEQLIWKDWVHLLLSVRYDWFLDTLDQSRLDTASSALIDQKQASPTFRVGTLLQPKDTISVFASYSQGFRPNLDPFANEQLDPQRSHQVEGGVKLSLFQDYVTATATGFYLQKSNVVIVNPVSQVLNIAGQRNASGFEADVVGELIPGLNVIAGYSLLRAKVAKGDPRPEGTPGVGTLSINGNTPPASPTHSGRLWATYRIRSGPTWLHGFKLGAGLQGRSEVQGDIDNTLQHPGYVKLDAMLGWTKQLKPGRLDCQINIKNLADKRYFDSTVRNFIKPGPPFTIMGQVAFRVGAKRKG